MSDERIKSSKKNRLPATLISGMSLAAVLVGCDKTVSGNNVALKPSATAPARDDSRSFDDNNGSLTIQDGKATINWQAMHDDIHRDKSVYITNLQCAGDNSFSAQVSADLDPQNTDPGDWSAMQLSGQSTVTKNNWLQYNYAVESYPCSEGRLTYGMDPMLAANALIATLQLQK